MRKDGWRSERPRGVFRRGPATAPGLTPRPLGSRMGTGSKVISTFHRPGSMSRVVQLSQAETTALLASQGIYPRALYPAPAWASGFPAGWASDLLSPTVPAAMSENPLGGYGGGGGGLSGGGNGGGFSLSSIPSWVWVGAAIFGGIVLLKGKGKTGGGGSMIPKNFKFKPKVK